MCYLPCPLYLLTALSLGPADLAAFPPFRLPNETFVEDADFAFAMVVVYESKE